MKLARTAMTAAVLAGVCLGAWAQAPKLEGLDIVLDAVPAGPVALVNNQPIPSEEFVELYKGELTRYQQMRPQDTISDAFRIGLALRCMRTLIEKELLLQEAEKRDVTISDEVVEQRWAKEIENIGKQLSQNKDKPLTEEEVLKEAGAKRENAIAELREALLIEKMREIIAKDQGVTVTDDEVKKQFEEMNKDGARPSDRAHMRQIFLRAPAGAGGAASSARETARNKAQEALSRIRAGRNFEAVAKEVSDEPFRSKGGDLGPALIETMPDFMAEAARTLSPGEISDVIESEFGYHIIQLVELLPGEEVTYEKAAPFIKSTLMLRKTNAAVEEFCRKATENEDAIQTALDLDKKLITHPELLDMLDVGKMPAEAPASLQP
ncbi:MAG TPA: peptidylprolyl isomerase [Candidatus Hydrogenedentes bacterium]|nr:peptidylprolyl isomerase [Candidatus Hydrogenedentota bacterium]HQH51424.1 peptidylprolyl isomerase [Candidatus Hydrogenedentota bacterium]HQM48523.1 peptidylprolyl isomerase [Candidatus Hydrogenedentota bacterium]